VSGAKYESAAPAIVNAGTHESLAKHIMDITLTDLQGCVSVYYGRCSYICALHHEARGELDEAQRTQQAQR
jgi:hypothetical protein